MPQIFDFLPVDVSLRIFNKLTPVTYVSLRKTCKGMDNFCESYRGSLRIRLKGEYNTLVFNMSTNPDKIYVSINTGSLRDRININCEKNSISGFYFEAVQIKSQDINSDGYAKMLQKAKRYFTQVVASLLKPSTLMIEGLPVEFVVELAQKWNLPKLQVDFDGTENALLDSLAYKKVKAVNLKITSKTDLDLMKIARNKTEVELTVPACSEAFFQQLIALLQEMKLGSFAELKSLSIKCDDCQEKLSNALAQLDGCVFIGGLETDPYCNIWWLYQLDEGRWAVIDTTGVCEILLRVVTSSGDSPIDTLCDTAKQYYKCLQMDLNPIDHSVLYEALSGLKPADVGDAMKKHFTTLKKFYT